MAEFLSGGHIIIALSLTMMNHKIVKVFKDIFFLFVSELCFKKIFILDMPCDNREKIMLAVLKINCIHKLYTFSFIIL